MVISLQAYSCRNDVRRDPDLPVDPGLPSAPAPTQGQSRFDLASRGGYLIDAQSQSGKVSGPTTGLRDVAETHRLKEKLGSGGPAIDRDTRSSRIEIN